MEVLDINTSIYFECLKLFNLKMYEDSLEKAEFILGNISNINDINKKDLYFFKN